MARLARTLVVLGLLGINAALIGLNLEKHRLFPFDDATVEPEVGLATESGIEPGPGESTDDDGSLAASADSAADTSAGVSSSSSAADADPVEVVDDWPGGRGPVPDGPPVPRRVGLRADGTVSLSGSAPSWAVATAVAGNIGRHLSLGIAGVLVDMTWHPYASAQTAGGVVAYDPAILYGAGQVAVPDEAVADLDRVAEVLADRPTVFVVVVGHIDDLGDSDENATVAVARASAVAQYVEDQGVDRARIVVAVAPAAPNAPPNDTDEARAFNRRVEVRFENFLVPQAFG